MRKKLLLFAIAMFSVVMAQADFDGVYVWVDGSETCYQLQKTPTVSCIKNGEVLIAQLFIDGSDTPILELPLTDDAELRLSFSSFDPVINAKDELNQLVSYAKKIAKEIKTDSIRNELNSAISVAIDDVINNENCSVSNVEEMISELTQCIEDAIEADNKATGIESVEFETIAHKVSQIGKYIVGGKIIIVKDGKQYNINGLEIK